MKIYQHKPIHLVRLTITKLNEETFYLNLCDTNQEEVIIKLKKIIDNEKLSVFQEGNRTRVDIRDCIGGKNGKCKSISFKGLTPKETNDLIIAKIPS